MVSFDTLGRQVINASELELLVVPKPTCGMFQRCFIDLKLKSLSMLASTNWYPVSDLKPHFKRACKVPKASHIAAPLTPGQVVIILSGRFRGRRVVFLKKLESNLLLVTGPYKYNGVPLKRVNAAYVLPTNTKLN